MTVLEKVISQRMGYMAGGALLSLALAVGALLIGIVIGLFGAMGRISRHKPIRVVTTLYVELVRGTPMLLQIMFLFMGLPSLINMFNPGQYFRPDPFWVGLIAMGINSGAYTTELVRSGIQSVDKGQMEAGRSLGFTNWATMLYIILPQAFKRILPPLVSEFIVLIKDSSLVSSIGVLELLGRTRKIGSDYFNYAIPLLVASCIYLVMTVSASILARKLERKLSVSD